jgi:hypothetical protein
MLSEYREGPNRIRQIERRRSLMAAIEGERLQVARLCQLQTPRILMDLAQMSNHVSQDKRIASLTGEVYRLLVQRARGSTSPKVSLNLAKSLERLYQLPQRPRLATHRDRFGQISLGIGQSILSARMSGPSHKTSDSIRHRC